MLEWWNVDDNVTMWNVTYYINLYLLDRRYLTGFCINVDGGTGRESVVSHGGHKS